MPQRSQHRGMRSLYLRALAQLRATDISAAIIP
ncbi:protein of unknown function (plasmid) [Cupriavidus taiwanensis]|uniref:Uncharacterized protein n=1 Tax=Cupriavidus taiwanensis TaxID=164546 RepID=A0A375IUC9_9BURK|nr:protein of unknown function [Cupriavidus taiwanensis]